jgi:hypothetical protein
VYVPGFRFTNANLPLASVVVDTRGPFPAKLTVALGIGVPSSEATLPVALPVARAALAGEIAPAKRTTRIRSIDGARIVDGLRVVFGMPKTNVRCA